MSHKNSRTEALLTLERLLQQKAEFDAIPHDDVYNGSSEERELDAQIKLAQRKLKWHTMRHRVRLTVFITGWVVAFALVSAIAAIGYYGYTLLERPKFGQSFANCEVPLGDSGATVKGIRKATFNYYDILGRWRFTPLNSYRYETRLTLEGSTVTVVGKTEEGGSWHLRFASGERYNALLKPATEYTFVVGADSKSGGVTTVAFDAFCP